MVNFRAEKVRSATDSRLVTIQKELSACKDQSDKYLGQRDKLVIELKTTREKMKNVEADLLGSRGEAAKYLAALKDVLYRVQPLATPPPPPKKEEPKVEIKVINIRTVLSIMTEKVLALYFKLKGVSRKDKGGFIVHF